MLSRFFQAIGVVPLSFYALCIVSAFFNNLGYFYYTDVSFLRVFNPSDFISAGLHSIPLTLALLIFYGVVNFGLWVNIFFRKPDRLSAPDLRSGISAYMLDALLFFGEIFVVYYSIFVIDNLFPVPVGAVLILQGFFYRVSSTLRLKIKWTHLFMTFLFIPYFVSLSFVDGYENAVSDFSSSTRPDVYVDQGVKEGKLLRSISSGVFVKGGDSVLFVPKRRLYKITSEL